MSKEEGKRLPKRRVALLFGYCGSGYSGLQLNANAPSTIEKVLIEALVTCNLISAENATDPSTKAGWNRCARTDKGVHAAGQVVSFKMNLIPMSDENTQINDEKDLLLFPEYKRFIVDLINTHVPVGIRVWDVIKVTGKFNSKNHCFGREYAYLLPTFVLKNSPHLNKDSFLLDEHALKLAHSDKKLFKQSCHLGKVNVVDHEILLKLRQENLFENELQDSFELGLSEKIDSKEEDDNIETLPGEVIVEPDCILEKENNNDIEENWSHSKDFRLDSVQFERFTQLLKTYEGFHCFHNYTMDRPYWDQSSNRLIRSVNVSKPFIWEQQEWVEVQISGQSFMLHQIRKMIGMVILCMRTNCSESLILESFKECRLNIPKAPALGLLLEQPLFDSYNENLNAPLEKLVFAPYKEEMMEFKRKYIHAEMIKKEVEKREFYGWLQLIEDFAFDYGYFVADGKIPPAFFELAKTGKYDIENKPKRIAEKSLKVQNQFKKRKYNKNN